MKAAEPYLIGQSSRRSNTKSDYFNWDIWIEDGKKPITEIESVEYLLHPTFPNRLRSSSDVAAKFKLKSKGWGEFTIRVIIYEKSGKKIILNHWLTLRNEYTTAAKESEGKADSRVSEKKQSSSSSIEEIKPRSEIIFSVGNPKDLPPKIAEEKPKLKAKSSKKKKSSSKEDPDVKTKKQTGTRETTKTVYLSYTNADTRLAQNIESELTNLGLKVKSPSEIPPGTTVADYIKESIVSSDAIVQIVPDYEDPWQKHEIEIANNAGKKTLSIQNTVQSSLYDDPNGSSFNQEVQKIANQI